MKRFSVNITASATGDLDATQNREQIISDIKKLYDNPLPTGINIKKLKGFNPPLYRLRSGNYRVLYRIEGPVVTIMRIIDRKELERTIKRIRKSS
ncbi:MAG: type II toxin-antitoxin system RelE/ParE family toxin [Thermodesulfobacteriota bacterium]